MLPSARQAGWLSAGLPLLALSIALAACGGKTAQMPALADSSLRPDRQADIIVPAGKPIVIGVSAPLSGPDSSSGGEDREAVITGVNRWKERNGGTIDGHEIVVRAEDDGCTEADITVQAAERLLRTEGLVGVIGPNCSAGYAGTFGAGDAAASLRDFVEPVGASEAEGVVFSGCPLDLPTDFVGSYTRLHGSAPEASVFVGQYADAATVLLAAVAAVAQEQPDGSLVIDPGDLRDAVAASDLPDGISGAIAFDTNGDRVPERGASVAEVTNTAIQTADLQVFVRLGLVPCQVHDGKLVNPLEAIESGP